MLCGYICVGGLVNNISKCINNVVNCKFTDESKLVIGNVFLNILNDFHLSTAYRVRCGAHT